VPAAAIIYTPTAVGGAVAAVGALQGVECCFADLVSYSYHGLFGQEQRELCGD
jgi:hypothetical protein